MQPDDETVKKVNPIQLDMNIDIVISTNQTSTKSSEKVAAQHLGRFVLRRSPSRQRRAKAVKADVAEQFKAEKSVTERTAEDAVVEASQIKHVAVERSLKIQTPQLRRSLWSQRLHRLSQRRQP